MISVLNGATDGIIDWWKLDETTGTNATDSAGSSPGTLLNFAGASHWTTGKIGGALSFDGVSNYISLDGSPLNQVDIIGLYVSLSGNFKICSLELLNMFGDKKAYSLAQGQ